MTFRRILQIIIITLCTLELVDGCTTIAVGRDATTDGSILCSHSNDGEGDTDPRLVFIPASDWSNGTRPIFFSPESYPRYVGVDRATTPIDAYHPSNNKDNPPFEPICSIPQISHTYSYMEETYGALNSRQLGIAESTCSGVFGAAPRGITQPDGTVGKACFSIDTLTQIAMERHHRARDAIQEIGNLAVEMGFYGAGLFEGTAESLLVTDKEEAWVFHILPDPTGASAIWAAQRVPDDGFVTVANAFVIRVIDLDDEVNFMYSESVKTVANDLGWWTASSGEPLDFTALYSDGEYSHKYYSGRRAWGVFHLFAPSLELSPEYEEWRISSPYPFSATPDRKISLEDVAKAMRYFYQGTEFSQAGRTSRLPLAGGPWSSPDHVAGGSTSSGFVGNWERTIGLYRSSDTYIVQSRGWLPDHIGGTLWWGAYAAPYAVYVPFPSGVTSLPDSTLGHHMRLDKNTLFWANRYVGNYVQLKWDTMMEEVLEFQQSMMSESLGVQATVDAMYLEATKDDDDMSGMSLDVVSAYYQKNAMQILQKTWDLTDHLMFKYADGQIHYTTPSEGPLGSSTTPRKSDAKGMTVDDALVVDQPGYPKEWLKAVGFTDGPPPPPDCADLDWRCGHKVSSHILNGSTLNHLRGYEMVTTADDKAGIINIWREYYNRKAVAIDNGIAGCFSRGDISAVVDSTSCTVEIAMVTDEGDDRIFIS